MNLTDQAGGKDASVCKRLWEIRWPGKPPPRPASQLPPPKSNLHLSPSSTPSSSSPPVTSPPPPRLPPAHKPAPSSQPKIPNPPPPSLCLLHSPPEQMDICCHHLPASYSPLSPHDLPVAGTCFFLSCHQGLPSLPNQTTPSHRTSHVPPGHCACCPLCLECPSVLLHMAN